ncbi:MAG: LPS-assembly protein LptD [Alphaproteobacteria bacterium]|nr:LPS-assembly protein LptD [Alphaproteobacteria bacterium]
MADRPGFAWWRLCSAIVGTLLATLFVGTPTPAGAQFSLGGGSQQDQNAPIVFRADEVEYDEQLALTVARGHVEISQNGRVLLADVVSYNQRTDTVTASGNVSFSQPTGEIVFADFMELRDSMSEGFAKNVRMLLADRSRLAANTARRTNGNRTELRRGVYSPCDLCKNDPSAPPAWQLKAREIDHDKELQLIEFRDATMEIDGWPVFYSPYMSAPDPSVKRASGFLVPSIGGSNTLGANVTIPYYWVLGPDKDLTLTPRFMTQAGALLTADYRERFGNGSLDAIASGNHSNVGFGSSSSNQGEQWRGQINEHSVFDLDETYRTGLDVQRVSDQTFLTRFGFGNPLLNAMTSRGYLEGFEERASTDINTYAFQPLLPGIGDSTQPIVLPVANRNWQSQPDALGGRWNLNANVLDILREVGTQTRRLSLGSEWNRTFRDAIGGQYDFSAGLRGDGYSINNLSAVSNPELPSAFFPTKGQPAVAPIPTNFVTGRAFPQVGLVWSYPLIHRGEEITELIEPIAGGFAGPSSGNRRNIPDEDSLSFNFTDSDLFRRDRLAGYDILDTGQRVDYGTKLGLYDKDGGSYRLLIGQSYRAQPNTFLPLGSGAENRLSDVVGRVVLSPNSYLDLIYRFRFDTSPFADRVQQVGVSAGPQSLRVSGSYIYLPAQLQSQVVTNPATGQNVLYGKREQLVFTATAKLTHYWSVQGSQTVNLTNSTTLVNGLATPSAANASLYASLSAIYQDECMAFIGSVTQSGVRNGDVTPGVSVTFSVVFKNLGEIGGTVAEFGTNILP